jgi:uncharacterized membrane protein
MENLIEQLRNIPVPMKYLYVFLLSMVPLIEQRGAIPLGFAMGLNPAATLIVSLSGSLVPVPFILWFFTGVYRWMHGFRIFSGFVRFMDGKIRKNTPKLEKYKEIGLIIFVGIPLPTTGLWTGSMVAAFLGLSFWKSFICGVLGGLLSALAITIMILLLGGLFI